MYSFIEHKQEAINKREEFTILTMEWIEEMFKFFDLEVDKNTVYHVRLLKVLEDRELFLMKQFKNDIVSQGVHWSRQVQINNVMNIMRR